MVRGEYYHCHCAFYLDHAKGIELWWVFVCVCVCACAQENPNPHMVFQKLPRPSEGSHLRVHMMPFPWLQEERVEGPLSEATSRQQGAPPTTRTDRQCAVR